MKRSCLCIVSRVNLRLRFFWLSIIYICILMSGLSINATPSSPNDAHSPFKRVVSLGGGVSEIIFALGLGNSVVAVDVSSVYPPEATKKPKVGYVRATSAEGIASMKPDLVISSEVFGPPAVRKQLKQAGIRLELVSESKSIESAVERIKAVGRIFKREKQAFALAQQLEKVIQTPPPKGPKPKILFLFSHGGTSLLIAGDETGANTMIKAAGGVNAVSGYKGYKPLTAEAVIKAQPDLVLMTTRSFGAIKGVESLWKVPGLALTPAGKNKNSLVMEDLKLLGFGPRTGEAIQELRHAFFSKTGKEE